MGQIVIRNQVPVYCNLAAIQSGGTKANQVLANGEIWLVDTSNANKTNGTGVYDAYIKGNGSSAAKNLTVQYLTTQVDLSAYSTTQQMNTAIQNAVSEKQDTISDLSTIRSGAALGATAIQEHQDISGKADANNVYTKSEVNNLIVPANTTISVVETLPASGAANTIYRAAGSTNYKDYGWDGTQFVELATYDNLIDNTPTKDSNNLVKSSGVYNGIKDIDNKIDAVLNGGSYTSEVTETLLPTWTEGKGIDVGTGSITTAASSSASGKIDISEFSGYTLTYSRSVSTSSSSTVGLVFYGSDNAKISYQAYDVNGAERALVSTQIAIPANAAYVRFSCFTELLENFFATITYTKTIVDEGLTEKVNTLTENVGTKYETQRDVSLDVTFTNSGLIYATTSAIGKVGKSSVSKYSDKVYVTNYTGGSLTYTKNVSTTSNVGGLVFYDISGTPIIGYVGTSNAQERGYIEETVTIPDNATYARFTFYEEYLEYFSATINYVEITFSEGLGKSVQENTSSISELKTAVKNLQENVEILPEYTEVECRRRFYDEMTQWCENHSITGAIIEGPSGYGLGGEVENEVLGHGKSSVPIDGVGKIMAAALDYKQLNTIWQRDTHVIKTQGIVNNISIARSLDSHYGSVIENDYTILGWKTGSNGGLTNLAVAVTHPILKGDVLIAVMSRNYQPDTEENNRSLATKYLLDIGLAKYQNKSADVSSLETSMLEQHAVHAIVFICPSYPAFMHKWNLQNDSYHLLYSYSLANINTMSMIKVLVAILTIDYIPNLDALVTIQSDDITAATGGTGSIFVAGEKVTYRDLLCALLMPSSNQAGYVLARKVGEVLLQKY